MSSAGNINDSRSTSDFVPRQALSPTAQLYAELVGDTMENLARVSLRQAPPIASGAVVHDNGCGTGAATAAVADVASAADADVAIVGTDVDEDALEIYRRHIVGNRWPATAHQMDSRAMSFDDSTFTHSIGNALLFVLPEDGVGAVREAHRCLRPGGILIVNSWHYVPNMGPVQAAAAATMPPRTSMPREGMEKWSVPEFIRDVVVEGGFAHDNIRLAKGDVFLTTPELNHFASMLWSFMGGTAEAGWLESDEQNWDRAIDVVKDELRKTRGYEDLGDGRARLKFVANIVVATK